jgi:exodeoxyribonuclease VII small subunit
MVDKKKMDDSIEFDLKLKKKKIRQDESLENGDESLVKKGTEADSEEMEKAREGLFEGKEELELPIAQNFEEAIERLSLINTDLQSGKLPLEDALKKYEEAIGLRQYATDLLAKARLRMTVAGEKKAVAVFRMQLEALLSEFAEQIAEDFQEKRETSEETMRLLGSKIKMLMTDGTGSGGQR